MGILSDIQKYHGADERPSERGGQVFGAPARTIFTELDPGDVHQKITVKDEQGQPLYWTRSSVFTLRGKTDVFDAGGAQVAHLEKKPISLHEEHYITLTDGRKLTLSNELFHVFRDITVIQGLGWKLQGNVLGLNFTLKKGGNRHEKSNRRHSSLRRAFQPRRMRERCFRRRVLLEVFQQ